MEEKNTETYLKEENVCGLDKYVSVSGQVVVNCEYRIEQTGYMRHREFLGFVNVRKIALLPGLT
jgi:hypothetical protein